MVYGNPLDQTGEAWIDPGFRSPTIELIFDVRRTAGSFQEPLGAFLRRGPVCRYATTAQEVASTSAYQQLLAQDVQILDGFTLQQPIQQQQNRVRSTVQRQATHTQQQQQQQQQPIQQPSSSSSSTTPFSVIDPNTHSTTTIRPSSHLRKTLSSDTSNTAASTTSPSTATSSSSSVPQFFDASSFPSGSVSTSSTPSSNPHPSPSPPSPPPPSSPPPPNLSPGIGSGYFPKLDMGELARNFAFAFAASLGFQSMQQTLEERDSITFISRAICIEYVVEFRSFIPPLLTENFNNGIAFLPTALPDDDDWCK